MYRYEGQKPLKMADYLMVKWQWLSREDVISQDLIRIQENATYLNEISCDDEQYLIEEIPYEAY